MELHDRQIVGALSEVRGTTWRMRDFVHNCYARLRGGGLSKAQRAYLYLLAYRFRRQLPPCIADVADELKGISDQLATEAAAEKQAAKTNRTVAAEPLDCTPQMPLFGVLGGFFG